MKEGAGPSALDECVWGLFPRPYGRGYRLAPLRGCSWRYGVGFMLLAAFRMSSLAGASGWWGGVIVRVGG